MGQKKMLEWRAGDCACTTNCWCETRGLSECFHVATEKSADSLFHSLDNTAVQEILIVPTANGRTKTRIIQFAATNHSRSAVCAKCSSHYTFCQNNDV